MLRKSLIMVVLAAGAATADTTIEAPSAVDAGEAFTVRWVGAHDPRDFITIVPPDTAEGKYGPYHYARRNPVDFTAPDDPGSYEIRYLGATAPFPTLARASRGDDVSYSFRAIRSGRSLL